jgi:hypothetical protein
VWARVESNYSGEETEKKVHGLGLTNILIMWSTSSFYCLFAVSRESHSDVLQYLRVNFVGNYRYTLVAENIKLETPLIYNAPWVPVGPSSFPPIRRPCNFDPRNFLPRLA